MIAQAFDESDVDPVDAIGESWAPRDLGPVLAGQGPPGPELLLRSDGRPLLYPGRVHSVAGESETGKSMLMLLGCVQELRAGRSVVWIDFEDTPDSVTGRLRDLGVSDAAILELFVYIQPDEPYGLVVRDDLDELLKRLRPPLVVLDGVTNALALNGVNMSDNGEYASWYRALPKRCAAFAAAVVLIDHVAKSIEARGRYAIGAQHKLAVIDGAAFTVEPMRPFGRGRDGTSKLILAKDRPGHLRGYPDGPTIGMVQFHSDPDGGIRVDIDPPNHRDPSSAFRPTTLMERVSRALEAGTPLSVRALRGAVKGNNEAKALAVELLIADGYIAAEPVGKTVMHRLVRPFRSDQGDPE